MIDVPFTKGHYVKLVSGERVLIRSVTMLAADIDGWDFLWKYKATGLVASSNGTVREMVFYEGAYKRHLSASEIVQCKLMGMI